MRPRPDLGSVVLVEQERHASGLRHLELPRGFAEPCLSGRENALKELREETGFAASECSQLGRTFTDTGISAAQVSCYHAKITSRAAPAPEKAEIIERCVCLSKEELKAAIAAGEITDSFTLQALALSELGQS